MSAKFTYITVTTERSTCDCCGRKGLKKTIALRKQDGQVVFYGVDCAALALTGSKKNKSIVETNAAVIAYAGRLIAENIPTEKVLRMVFNAYGYSGEAKNGLLRWNGGLSLVVDSYRPNVSWWAC